MESFPEMTSKVTALARAAEIDDPGRVSGAGTGRPDPEVPERARRRTFTAKYKLEILAAYAAAAEGEKGALLPPRGSVLQPHRGVAASPPGRCTGRARGARGRRRRDPQQEKIARLEAEKQRLEQELAKARFVVDVQAKLHALLETLSESGDTEPRSMP